MGRVTTRSNDAERRPLVSYVAPGSDSDVYAFAAIMAARAVKEGRDELYEVECANTPVATLTADEVRAFAMLLT